MELQWERSWLYVLCCVFILKVSSSSSIQQVVVESSPGRLLVTTNSGSVLVVSGNRLLCHIGMFQGHDSSPVLVEYQNKKPVVCLHDNCSYINTSDCTVASITNNDQYSYVYGHTIRNNHLTKYGKGGNIVWQTKLTLSTSTDFAIVSFDILVQQEFVYAYVVTENHHLFIFQFKDNGNTVSLMYRALLIKVQQNMHVSFGKIDTADLFVIIAHSNTVKTLPLSVLNNYCYSQNHKVSLCLPPVELLSADVVTTYYSTVVSIATTNISLFIGLQNGSVCYIIKYHMLSAAEFVFEDVRVLSHCLMSRLIWDSDHDLLYCISDKEIVGYKYPPAIIVKQSSKLQVVSGIEIDHFKNVHYVSLVTNSLQVIDQAINIASNQALHCCFYDFCIYDCKGRSSHFLYCRTTLQRLLSSNLPDFKIMFVSCSIQLRTNHARAAVKLIKRSSEPSIMSVIPSTVILALVLYHGGNIVSFIGKNFNSGRIRLYCSNQYYQMRCDHYNDTVITCLSPSLSSTACSRIEYDGSVSVTLSSIGLSISPNPVIEALSYSLDGSSMNLIITGSNFMSVVRSQISVLVAKNLCTLVSVESKMITCIAQLSNTNLQKVSLNITITMAGFSYTELIEHSMDNESQDEGSISYVPIIVVIIILFTSFVILILGIVGASLWKRKHNRTIDSQQMNMVIKPHQLAVYDNRMRQPIEDHKENIYESVQEYQKSIVTTAKEEPVAHVNPPHCNVKNDPFHSTQPQQAVQPAVVLPLEEQAYIPMHSASTAPTTDYNNNNDNTVVEQAIPEYITMVST